MAAISSGGSRMAVLAIAFQILMLILFIALGRYGDGAAPTNLIQLTIEKNEAAENAIAKPGDTELAKLAATAASAVAAEETLKADNELKGLKYSMFQDVHVMIFVGFGFLMTFLARYGFGAVGFNFLISALAIQWAVILNELIHGHDYIAVGIENLLAADFATAAVLISFGAVLGKASALQLLVMTILELILFHVNEIIGRKHLMAVDAGDSIFVHAFGAYFGLAVARVLFKPGHNDHPKETSVYHSDLFAMIGSIFLWLFWPSFNSGGLEGEDRHRAVVNTYLALGACCVTAFAVSALVDKKGKLNMVHVQNSTLAGGVAVGAIGNFVIQPWGAILVGIVAAIVSVLGYQYLTPFLASRLGIHDTCGVHNLHGMPAVIAALGSVIAAAVATKENYQDSLKTVFNEAKEFSAGNQAGYQLAALAVTLVFAIVGGAITGFIMRIPIWGQQQELFEDAEAWLLPGEDEDEEENKDTQLQAAA